MEHRTNHSIHHPLVVTPNDINKVSSGWEQCIANWGDIFPWMGTFKLEIKTPLLFEAQKTFESVIQTRIYRYYDKRGNPTKCCMRFVYDASKPDGFVEWSKESREILIQHTGISAESIIDRQPVGVRNI